ncbi:MAG: right-handed parallel beta-helix repeat-containing protein [Mariniphaga sp.]|nr:right-handed parallel beta-helix repeat-containing protein [Mariniphaga sp.]
MDKNFFISIQTGIKYFIVLLICLSFSFFNEAKSKPIEVLEANTIDDYFVSPNGNDENPGTKEKPFRSIDLALSKLSPGKTLTFLEGTYNLTKSVVLNMKGNKEGWITLRGEPGVSVILDGLKFNISPGNGYPNNNGLIQIEDAAYIRVQNITVRNSHRSCINIQDSEHVDIINCTTKNSLSPGIAAWQNCEHIRILGNTVINANDMGMSWEPYRGSEAPHEAISMAGPHYFEVAWNHVYDCRKEGIDVKETASFGKVHHNYVHNNARQGLYIDGWFGELRDIEMYDNVVHGCEAGIAVSSEEGPNTKNLKIHHNLIYNNRATGIFFSRWGADNPREDVEVYSNTFYQNGWGPGFRGDPQYWLNGGCYLFTHNLKDVTIRNNIFAKNMPFEIGYSERWNDTLFEQQNIVIDYNLIQDINTIEYPLFLEAWSKDHVSITTGKKVIEADPLFIDPASGDFRLQTNSPAIDAGHPNKKYNDSNNTQNDIGVFPLGTKTSDFWWLDNFPPVIDIDDL